MYYTIIINLLLIDSLFPFPITFFPDTLIVLYSPQTESLNRILLLVTVSFDPLDDVIL